MYSNTGISEFEKLIKLLFNRVINVISKAFDTSHLIFLRECGCLIQKPAAISSRICHKCRFIRNVSKMQREIHPNGLPLQPYFAQGQSPSNAYTPTAAFNINNDQPDGDFCSAVDGSPRYLTINYRRQLQEELIAMRI